LIHESIQGTVEAAEKFLEEAEENGSVRAAS
jgi:hypothetical protein